MAFKSILDAPDLRLEFQKAHIDPKFIPLIWKFAIKNPNCNWDDIRDLPSSAYALLKSNFKPLTSSLHSVTDSSDGVTTKLLIKLQNNAFVEAVIMRYDPRLGTYCGKPRPGGPRSTLCISSQVGCKMGCKFCATGTMGLKNNLSSGEIIEQLVHASHISKIRNIVFMGMGEPLNNYTSLVEALRMILGSPFWFSRKHVTVSTVGIIHGINKTTERCSGSEPGRITACSGSGHTMQDYAGSSGFPLERLIDALQAYQSNTQKKIFIEYIMLDGVNDEEQHARLLAKLLETLKVVVNLIPFNPIGTSSQFRSSCEGKVLMFQKLLREVYQIRTTVRRQMGRDISGACGQLVLDLHDGNSNANLDIEDFCSYR